MDAGAKFLLRQAALFEKLVHQLVVGLGDVLDQLAVQFLDLRLPFAGGRLFLVFAAGIGRVGHHFIAQHVQHPVEAGAGIHRNVQRKDAPAKPLLHLAHHRVEIHVLLVHPVHHDHFRDAVAGRVIPHPVGADADPVLRVNHHQREIADAQRAQPFADEVEITGRINDVELFPHPLRVQQRSGDGNLAVLFADVVIRHRGAVGDAAHAGDDAAAHEHGLAKHRLAGRSVTDDGEVTDVCRSVIFHSGISFNLETVETATARDSKECGPFEDKCNLANARR